MLDRLNGWQRMGVLLTGLWALFVSCGALVGNDLFVETIIEGEMPRCYEREPGEGISLKEAMHGCDPGALVGRTQVSKHFSWRAFIAWATVPTVLGWLLVYLLVFVVRWARNKAT